MRSRESFNHKLDVALGLINEVKSSIPDSKIYYRVFDPNTNKDVFVDDAVEALRAIQSFDDKSGGSVTTYYNVDGSGPANWASNIAYEYFLIEGGSVENDRWEHDNDVGYVHLMNVDASDYLEDVAEELEIHGLNPNYQIPESDLMKMFKNLLKSHPTSEPNTIRIKSKVSDYISNDVDSISFEM
jgi:hypothetical protein